MNFRVCTLFYFLIVAVNAQSGIHNFGNLKLHDKGSLGFHTSFTNDASFDRNLGLIGFYSSNNSLRISGAFSPNFYDFEVAVEENLSLSTSISIDNSLQFIYGNIESPRQNKSVYTKFNAGSTFDGVLNLSKIDGYASVEDQKEFKFPVGYGNLLKPLKIRFIDEVFFAKCGYFRENPNFPKSSAVSMDTEKRDFSLMQLNDQEFWHMDTSGRVQLTLFWDPDSNLGGQTKQIELLTIAGWNNQNRIWDNLGNTQFEGDLNDGSVTSGIFNANDYEYFAIGVLFDENSDDIGNYAISPNGDGINDNFSLKIIDQSPNNEFRVFNRAGLLVYEKTNYKDEFHGMGNKNIFQANNYLPEGVYFYLLELKDLNRKYQGYFYLVVE